MIPYHIQQILDKNKITDFLESRGVFPSRRYSDKVTYCCPLHPGDKDPSFMVYFNPTYESYYCWGCKNGGTIINLLSSMDNISLRYAASILLEGIDVNEEEVLNSIIESLEKSIEEGEMEGNKVDDRIAEIFLMLNRSYYRYLKKVNFDKEEYEFLNIFFEKVDKTVVKRDLERLEKMYIFFVEKGLPSRSKKYFKRIEQEIIK